MKSETIMLTFYFHFEISNVGFIFLLEKNQNWDNKNMTDFQGTFSDEGKYCSFGLTVTGTKAA